LSKYLRLKSDYFNYDQFTWFPFNADINFSRDEVEINFTDADLCGISTPGVFKITPDTVSLEFKPVSKKQDIDTTVNCITAGKHKATGQFDLKAIIKGRGKPEAFLKSIEGDFELTAKKGRIYRNIALARVFAYLTCHRGLLRQISGF